MQIIYLVMISPHKQNEAIQVCLKTFSDSKLDIVRCVFPVSNIYCYLLIKEDMSKVDVIFNKSMSMQPPDIQLTHYEDIVGIPLMHNALLEAKKMNSL